MGKVVAALTLSLYLLAATIVGNGPSGPNVLSSAPLGSTDHPWVMFHYDSLRLGATLASAPGTGTLMWSYPTGAPVYASPAVSDGMVFIASYDTSGTVYAIDEYSGQLRWTFPTGTPIFSSPAVSNGVVYVGSRNGLMYALSEQTGSQIWGIGNPSFAITSSPVVVGGR